MVDGPSGHPGVAVLRLVVWAHALEHEPAQTLLHKEAGLTVWVLPVAQKAAT